MPFKKVIWTVLSQFTLRLDFNIALVCLPCFRLFACETFEISVEAQQRVVSALNNILSGSSKLILCGQNRPSEARIKGIKLEAKATGID